MALAAERDTDRLETNEVARPVAATTTIYAGALTCTDASGNAVPGSATTGLTAQGRCKETKDNSAGAAGDETVEILGGTFKWDNSGSDALSAADIGATAYIEDDETVCATGTGKSAAGVMRDIDSDGGIWVDTWPQQGSIGLLAANNLSDVATPATAAENIGVGVTDSPTFADVTTTDDVTVGDDLVVTGLATIGETLDVTGETTVDDLVVGGLATVAETLDVTGETTVDDLVVGGTADVAETLDVVGQTTVDDLTVGGLATVAETLAVTGVATLGAGAQVGPGTAGLVKVAKKSITAAQLKLLADPAIEVVAAVANKVLMPLMFHLKLEVGSEVLAEPSAPDDPIFNYVDKDGTAISAAFDAGLIIAAAADAYAFVPPIQFEGAALAAAVNVPIVIWNSGSNYTGNASGDAILEVTTVYVELDVS